MCASHRRAFCGWGANGARQRHVAGDENRDPAAAPSAFATGRFPQCCNSAMHFEMDGASLTVRSSGMALTQHCVHCTPLSQRKFAEEYRYFSMQNCELRMTRDLEILRSARRLKTSDGRRVYMVNGDGRRNLRIHVTNRTANLSLASDARHVEGTVVQKLGVPGRKLWKHLVGSTVRTRANQWEDCPHIGEPVSARTGATCNPPAAQGGRAFGGLISDAREAVGLGLHHPCRIMSAGNDSPSLFQSHRPQHLTFDHHFNPSCTPTCPECVLGMTPPQKPDQENELHGLPRP